MRMEQKLILVRFEYGDGMNFFSRMGIVIASIADLIWNLKKKDVSEIMEGALFPDRLHYPEYNCAFLKPIPENNTKKYKQGHWSFFKLWECHET